VVECFLLEHQENLPRPAGLWSPLWWRQTARPILRGKSEMPPMSQDPATIQLALIPLTTDTYLVELAPQGPGTSLLLAEGSFSGQASSVFHEPARLITGDSYFAPTAPQSRIPATSAELQGPDGQDGVLIGIGRHSSDANHPPESLLVRATASAVRYSVPYPVQTGGLILAESGAAFFGPTS